MKTNEYKSLLSPRRDAVNLYQDCIDFTCPRCKQHNQHNLFEEVCSANGYVDGYITSCSNCEVHCAILWKCENGENDLVVQVVPTESDLKYLIRIGHKQLALKAYRIRKSVIPKFRHFCGGLA